MIDLLPIVSNDADDVDKIIQKFNNIRIHGLYDDEPDKGSANQLKNKWYDKRL